MHIIFIGVESTLQKIADKVKWKDEAHKESFVRVIGQYAYELFQKTDTKI